jgi:hypothetical protein
MNKGKLAIYFLLTVAFFYFIYDQFFNKRKKLVRVVLKDVKDYGGILETDIKLRPFLVSAWQSVNWSVTEGNVTSYDNEHPWSAAAISYWMLKTGIKSFPKSASHSDYIVAAKNNREGNPVCTPEGCTKLKLYRANEVKPRVGDLICYPRSSGITYDNIYEGAATHCDIVVKVERDGVVAVGGNVGDAIRDTFYKTNNGFVTGSTETGRIVKYSDGRVRSGTKSLIGVIRNGHF